MINKRIRPAEVKKDVIALNDKLKQSSFNKMPFIKLIKFLNDEQLSLDAAKNDTIANLKMMMICCHYVKVCDEKDIPCVLKQLLGEEDINLPLLVNVQNMLTKRFPERPLFSSPTLINQIRDSLVILLGDSQYEKADIDKINTGIGDFIKKTPPNMQGYLLYTHVLRKGCLQLEPIVKPKVGLQIDVKPSASSNFILMSIASENVLLSPPSNIVSSQSSQSPHSKQSAAPVLPSPISSALASVGSTPSSVSSPSFSGLDSSLTSNESPRAFAKS